MINADMRLYDYFTLGATNSYGQPVLPKATDTPAGKISIAIYTTSQSIQDNINFKEAKYIGLTQAKVKDTYIINKDNELLKVLYVQPVGRFKQVFLGDL
jgi:hypothetical protein